MSRNEKPAGRTKYDDVRQRGFSDRVSVEQAIDWLEAHASRLAAEQVAPDNAIGRVLAEVVEASTDMPPCDCAAADGYALRSDETIGASDYNPLLFEIQNAGDSLRPMGAAMVAAGMRLPQGADAVLSFGASRVSGGVLEVYSSLAPGAGVERGGQQTRAGTKIHSTGHVIRPQDAALLASLGMEHVTVAGQPRVRLVVAGAKPIAKSQTTRDADGPLLQALIKRDGGVIESVISRADEREAIRRSMAPPGPDVIVAAGRTGVGHDDEAPLTIAEIGELAIHGVALRPGDSTAMGRVAGIPIVLLPGDPLACFCAYELFAGRLIRRMGGRLPELPYAVREAEVRRKIVSTVGFVDVCQVRLVDGGVEPVGSAELSRLASAVCADGFVLVPAPLEGYAPGARVAVHLY